MDSLFRTYWLVRMAGWGHPYVSTTSGFPCFYRLLASIRFIRRIIRDNEVVHANCGVGKGVSTHIVLSMDYTVDMLLKRRGFRRVCNGKGRSKNIGIYLFLVISGDWWLSISVSVWWVNSSMVISCWIGYISSGLVIQYWIGNSNQCYSRTGEVITVNKALARRFPTFKDLTTLYSIQPLIIIYGNALCSYSSPHYSLSL